MFRSLSSVVSSSSSATRLILANGRRLAVAPFHSGRVALQQQSAAADSAEVKPEPAAATETKTADVGAEDATKVELAKLKENSVKLEQQIAELNDKYLRSLAEMQNVRTIAKRDVENAQKFALQGFAKSLLEVADNLMMALAAVPEEAIERVPELKSLHEGIRMTDTVLLGIFNKQGIHRFGELGESFDPHQHQVLMEQPDASKPDKTISVVIRKGYRLHDRVIRPAQICIFRNPNPPAAAAATPQSNPATPAQ